MQRRARIVSSLVFWLTGCGMFEAPAEPAACERDPASCRDTQTKSARVGDPCRTDAQCQGDLRLTCAEGACAFAGDRTEGEACTVTNECGPNLYCRVEDLAFKCSPAGIAMLGERCRHTESCERGLVCSFDQGIDAHCIASGSGEVGALCSHISDCLPGLNCQLDHTEGTKLCKVYSPLAIPNPVWKGVDCGGEDERNLAYFRVPRHDGTDRDFFRLPFPNDVRRKPDGLDLTGFPSAGDQLGIGIDFVGSYVKAAAEDLTAFGTNPVIYFRFSQPYSAKDVDKNSVLLIDLTDPFDPDYGQVLTRAWGTSSGPVTRYVCQNWLNVRTPVGSPLKAGHTYVAALTRQIKTPAGDAFEVDADFVALLASSEPSDPALKAAYAAYAPLRLFLKTKGSEYQGQLLNAAVFTTQDTTSVIRGLYAAVQQRQPPSASDITRCDSGARSPCDDGGERTCDAEQATHTEVHARLELPIFQRGEAPYVTKGGEITLDKQGVASVARQERVCIGLSLPKTAAPEAGYPLVVYAHGTGGSFKSGLRDLASFAADHGAAVLTLDLPQHGSRKNGSRQDSEELFYNFANPRAARDNLAQGSADLFSLVRFALAVRADAQGPYEQAVHFDPSRLVFFGHSQGATHVSLALPYENNVRGAVLSGVGGDLSEALMNKQAPRDLGSLVPLLLGDPDAGRDETTSHCKNCTGSNHPVLALVQSFYERVDPVNFAHLLRQPSWAEPSPMAPKHVFMTYGLSDLHTPEVTQRAFASAASLDFVGPVLAPFSAIRTVDGPVSANVGIGMERYTQAARQYRPEAGEDGHFVYRNAAEADWQAFLAQLFAGEVPVIEP